MSKNIKRKSKSIVLTQPSKDDIVYYNVDKESFVRENIELFLLIKTMAKEEGYDLNDDEIQFLQKQLL